MEAGGDEFFSFVYDFPEDPFANKTHAQIRSGGDAASPSSDRFPRRRNKSSARCHHHRQQINRKRLPPSLSRKGIMSDLRQSSGGRNVLRHDLYSLFLSLDSSSADPPRPRTLVILSL